ncbi:hypothetical protein BDB01DRAFT_909638, partial [Pilobolus umbonatus]
MLLFFPLLNFCIILTPAPQLNNINKVNTNPEINKNKSKISTNSIAKNDNTLTTTSVSIQLPSHLRPSFSKRRASVFSSPTMTPQPTNRQTRKGTQETFKLRRDAIVKGNRALSPVSSPNRVDPSSSLVKKIPKSTSTTVRSLIKSHALFEPIERQETSIPVVTPVPLNDTQTSVPTPDDYYSHPQMPSFISDLYKKFNEHDGIIHELKFALDKIQHLEEALASSRQQVADLQSQLNRVTSSTDHEMNTDTTTNVDSPIRGSESSIHAPNSTHSNASPTAIISYASITAKSTPKRRTTASKKAIARSFMPLSTTQGFQFLYLHSRGKEPISVMRTKLRKLGIQSGRILDIHYPDNHVVGLLVHNDYAPEVTEILSKYGITIDSNFNPLSPSILRDPKLATLSDSETTLKAAEIHQNRLIHIIKRVSNLPRQLAIARNFLSSQWISQTQYDEVLTEIRPAASTTKQAPTTTKDNDENMSEV